MLPDPTRIEPGARTPWAAEGVWSSWRGGRDRSRLFGWPGRGHRGEGRRGGVVLVLGLLRGRAAGGGPAGAWRVGGAWLRRSGSGGRSRSSMALSASISRRSRWPLPEPFPPPDNVTASAGTSRAAASASRWNRSIRVARSISLAVRAYFSGTSRPAASRWPHWHRDAIMVRV